MTHLPPDDEHPDGKQILLRDSSPLKDRLEAQLEENQRRHELIKQAHTDRIAQKRQSQSDRGLPPEKSHL